MRFDGEKCAHCPEDEPNWNWELSKCAPACPPETPMYEDNRCMSCYEYYDRYHYWDAVDEVCVAECGHTLHTLGSDGFCHECADVYPDMPYSDGF